MTTPDNKDVLTVSQLNRRVRSLLESSLVRARVEGEISNFVQAASGHWYFTLKDSTAQVRCAMFRGFNQRASSRPSNGLKVIVTAKASLYENRGEYQLIADHIEEAGLGDLQKAFERLKVALSAEGLFDPVFKQEIPAFPKHLAVITSAQGAAIHDILNVLRKRFPLLPVTLLPVSVQGSRSAGEIKNAIEQANADGRFDLIILARGGGSLEDLWSFNEEIVARAIFSSDLPIVTGIGHETDFTISDFVADLRAPTPSAAAELISPDQDTLRKHLALQQKKLLSGARLSMRHWQQLLEIRQNKLVHPGQTLNQKRQKLDHYNFALQRHLSGKLQSLRHRLAILSENLEYESPQKAIDSGKETLAAIQEQLYRNQQNLLEDQQEQLATLAALLNSISPLNTLQRGYAILRNQKKEVIQSTEQVHAGEKITAIMANGSLKCTVDTLIMDNKDTRKTVTQ